MFYIEKNILSISMKSLNCVAIFYLIFFCFSNKAINNGDPFDYIFSDIVLINDAITFIKKVMQEDKIIVIFSYHNNHYGDTDFDFYDMAKTYSDLKKQFSYNRNIEFYRVYMNQGVSSLFLEPVSPAMQIYYQGEKIKSINGKVDKKFLLKNIIDSLRNNLSKGIFKENDYLEYLE